MLRARYVSTMKSPDSSPARPGPWTSLWVVALLSLVAQLWLCQFFSFGERVPVTIDVNPSNLWKLAYHFPPTGSFQVLNWLGVAYLPQSLQPFSLAAAHLSPWWFFTTYAPVVATLALLAMAAFLRELELPRPAALFGGVIFAWQGDLLSFVFPGHYAYITTWPFFAVAAWGALRAERTRHWAYAVISGAGCGLMVGLQPDRGAIASLLIAALYLAPIFQRSAAGRTLADNLAGLRRLILCVGVAALIALAPLLALFQSYIVGVKMAGTSNRAQTYNLVTQFSFGPAETLTYLAPGFFGWHSDHPDGPYWGWVGEWPDWPKNHQGTPNLSLAISTTGTIAAVLAMMGIGLLLPGSLLGLSRMTERQRFYGRLLLALGFVALILAFGWHTVFYRSLFDYLPLMDKWRNPLKWLEMTNFALVVLSALGMQHLLASLEADAIETKFVRRRLIGFTNVLLVVLCLGLAVSYPLALVLASRFQAEGYDYPTIDRITNTMHTSLLVALLLMALLSLILRALWQPEKLRRLTLVNPWLHRLWQQMLQQEYLPLTLALALAALAAVQLGWVAKQFIQPAPLEWLTATNPLLEELRSEGNAVRCSVATSDQLLDNLLLNQFCAMNISCLDISAASRIPDDLNAFFQALEKDRSRLWFLTGVKNVVVPQEGLPQLRADPGIAPNIEHADGYTLESTGSPDLPSHALVTMKDYLAKATLVPNEEFFDTDEALLKRLKDPAWNPRESVLLNPRHKLQPYLGDVMITPDKIDLKTYTPTAIEIEAHSVHGGYVLINDQYDPDWQVQVNGQTVAMYRADYIMRAIPIKQGHSIITLHYVAQYHVGEMIKQMAHINLGDFKWPVVAVNNFSDGAMLAAWLIAGFALRRKKLEGQPPA